MFGCPIRFDAITSAIVMEPPVLGMPMQRPEPELSQILEQHAEFLVGKLGSEADLVGRARRAIVNRLRDADVSLVHTARHLGMSVRTSATPTVIASPADLTRFLQKLRAGALFERSSTREAVFAFQPARVMRGGPEAAARLSIRPMPVSFATTRHGRPFVRRATDGRSASSIRAKPL